MSGRLAGKCALVTGAAQGIGLAIAAEYARQGASVVASDLNPRIHSRFSGDALISPHVLDVTDKDAIVQTAAAFPQINVLVNCAGFVHSGDILSCEEDAWRRSLEINLTSMYRTIRAFLPGMLERGGAIINVASVVSSIKGVPNRVAYGATKAGVIGLTKAVAADVVSRGVRCNALCPGTVDTPSLHDRLAATGDAAAAYNQFVARQPMGRLAQAPEIASAAVYLAADESAFMTGSVLVIDGGMSL